MINQLPTKGEGRAPRSILMIGGTTIDWTSWTMEHNGIHEAGTISIDVPAHYSVWSWWTQQTEILIDVYAGFPKNPQNFGTSDLTQLMVARIDELKLNPATQTFHLAGRDLTSLLTDNKSDAKYPNMTASDIATAIALKYGLTPNVQKTKGMVGAFYKADHVNMQVQQTPWTLLTYLAQHEGLQCFVLGRTLYFGDFGTTISNQPYLIDYTAPTPSTPFGQSNAERLDFTHDLTLAGDIVVRVRSYHGYKNAAYSATAPDKSTARTLKRIERHSHVAQAVQHYDYIFPGKTQEECQKKADELLKELSRHELKLDAVLPGDVLIYPWTPIEVRGTGTIFDATYQAARIRRSFDTRGFKMDLHCKTVPAQETVTLS